MLALRYGRRMSKKPIPIGGLRRWSEQSTDRIIARNFVLLIAMVLIARLASAAKEIAIASRFGTAPIVDGYVFVFNLINLPVAIWYSLITVTLVPLLTRDGTDDEDPDQFQRELLGWAIAASLGIGLLFLVALEIIVGSGMSGLAGAARAAALSFLPWLWILIPIGVITHFGSALLMAAGQHRNTVLEGVPALALLVVVLIAPGPTVTPLIAGTIIGAALHMTLVWRSVAAGSSVASPLLRRSSQRWRGFLAGVAALVIGQCLYALVAAFDQFFAASLPQGSVAALGYASRLTALVLTLGTTAIGRAALPVFSALSNDGNLAELARSAKLWTLAAMLCGVVIGLLLWPVAPYLVAALFERGSFKAADTAIVTDVFRWSLLQLPFQFSAMLTSQALFSQRRYGVVTLVAAFAVAAKLIASSLLVPEYGLSGLMMGTACFAAVNAVLLAAALWRQPRPLN